MALRDILVVLDASALTASRLALATSLAQRFDADLIGFCPHGLLGAPEFSAPILGYPAPVGLPGLSDLPGASPAWPLAVEPNPANPAEQAEAIGEAFLQALDESGVGGSYESEVGPAAAAVTRRARSADLVVLGQPNPEDPFAPAARQVVEEVLLAAGRPVLVVPYAGQFASVGANVLIGWTESREAARASHDALTLLDPGAKVTVLTVRRGAVPAGRTELPAAAIARHLARHGFAARAEETVAEATTPPSFIVRPALTEADVLLNYAADIGADLLVVGGYGHSRAREFVLGGVTRSLLATMTLPVLMSH